MYPDQFLDSNVLIGIGVKWDTHHHSVTHYMKRSGLQRHTSITVFEETKKVLFNRKKLIRDCLQSLSGHNFSQNSESISKKLEKLGNSHIQKLQNDDEKAVLKSFFNSTFEDIVKEIAQDPHDGLENYRQFAVRVMNKAIKSISQECKNNAKASIYLYNLPMRLPYPTLETDLYKIMRHDKDVEVILGSYYIKNHDIRSNVSFVTADWEHVLKNKTDIEKELNRISANPRMNVQSPTYPV